MDRATLRDKFLSNTEFLPKEKDINTPYLGEFDGKLKLKGISGKEAILTRAACTDVNGVLDDAKFAGKLIVKCLYLRTMDSKTEDVIEGGNTPLLEPTDGESVLSFDDAIFEQLGKEVFTFLGIGTQAQEAIKKNLETANKDNSTSPLLQGLDGLDQ